MKNKILIIKNISREGPGLLEQELMNNDIGYTIVDVSKGQSLPSFDEYKAVVILGGPDSANDVTDKMKNEIEFVRQVINANIPYLGICLGMQILVKATGGEVIKCPVKEIGFVDHEGKNYAIELTDEGKKDPLFNHMDNRFNVFHLHGETVKLPDNMTLLAKGKYCKNQIVKSGSNAYGIQCHFELTPGMLDIWINEDPDLMQLDKKQLHNSFKAIEEEYTKTGQQLFRNFLSLIS